MSSGSSVNSSASRLALIRDYLSITALSAADGTSNVLMPLLLSDAGYSAAEIGPLIAALAIAALISRFPVGALYRPARARWLLVGSLVIAAGCSLLYPYFVASTPLFLVLRVLHGLSSGVATTVNLAFFIDSQPAGVSRARRMGLYGGGMAAGFTLGNLLGGFAGDALGYVGAFALSSVFWIAGLCQALAAPPPAAKPAAAAGRSQPAAERRPRGLRSMLGALRDPGVVSVTMISFQLNAIHHVGGVFFPLIARGAGLGLAEIGLARSAYSSINAVARPFSSPFITRLGAARTSFWALALQGGTIACIPLVAFGGLPAFMLLFLLSGGLRAVGFTANAIAMAEDIPESRLSRGLSSGLFNAAKDLGNIAGPLIGSTLVSLVGLEQMFVVAVVLLLALQVAVTRGVEWSARQPAQPERSTR